MSPNGYTANPGEQVLLGAENGTYYLVVNLEDKVMKNADLRKAISLAINRQAICDLALEGTRDPGRQHRAAGYRWLPEGRLGELEVRRRGRQGGARRRRLPRAARALPRSP